MGVTVGGRGLSNAACHQLESGTLSTQCRTYVRVCYIHEVRQPTKCETTKRRAGAAGGKMVIEGGKREKTKGIECHPWLDVQEIDGTCTSLE